MLRLLVAAAAIIVNHADETVTLKRDAPPAEDEPEVQASMNSLGGAFMPAVGEDYENEAAKEAERVRLSQAAEQAEARARAEHAQRLEEAQRQYAAQQQAAQTAALERAKAEALAQAEAQAAAKAEADAAAAQEDASPETATHTPMHAEAAELAQAYAAAAETLSGISGEEEEAAEEAPAAEEAADEASPVEQAAAAEALRAENAARLREAVAQQQRQLREAELARRAEQQATLAEAQQQAGVTTDALREHTMPIKQEPRSPLESDLRPADAAQLKDIYQRDQKLAEMRSRAQVDPSTELRRAQAWAELPARERRSCAAEVSRITKNYKRGHYAVLGLRRSASQMEIRQRYRQKALLVHPEKNPSPDARLAFEQLREAGETLADDRLRDAYDRKLQRQQEEKLDHFRGEVLAFAETSAEYLQARLREFPRVLYGAAAVSFLLV
ncbi:unnamed protein product [Pelagomonas calceolata]|uniref:J domain-containing protein n=1 Tax=Pelagomonas calceolata TaxID=35677 RepID=A0A8J2WW62_9STRA|nr:unnamed protein product [Pelagomonas calceolata]|mmetsp:Transcript_4600/g.13788  ORF Transcript_4600/g.13788 Transcript_4600/m.13788 type:complete len:443 (+) Transcript_4600:197-1525(+)